MYSVSSRSTGLSPEQQHGINMFSLEYLHHTLTPITTAASSLANRAKEMKHAAESRMSAGNKVLFDNNHRSITTKELIASLEAVINALEGLQSKSTGLQRDVRYLAGYQEGLYQGHMRGILLADNVNWSTKQVFNIWKRGQKLCEEQFPDSLSALSRMTQANSFLPGRR